MKIFQGGLTSKGYCAECDADGCGPITILFWKGSIELCGYHALELRRQLGFLVAAPEVVDVKDGEKT